MKYIIVVSLLLYLSLNCCGSFVQNIHFALAGENGVCVSWLTKVPSASVVMYGTDTPLTMNATGYETSYAIKAGWNHNVVLTDLLPATSYIFSCGDPAVSMSPQYQFETPPSTPESTTVLAYGDLGTDNSQNTIQQISNRTEYNEFDIVIHMGDISYANDHGEEYESTWNYWFLNMQTVMTAIPYMTAPGNHESICKSFDGCFITTANFTTYKQKFRMPGNESGTGTNMFYSFDYGYAHYIAISTESDYPGAPALESNLPEFQQDDEAYFQVNWLQEDLKKAVANRKNIPWIIIFGHRPIYAPLEEKDNVPIGYSLALQTFLEPMLKEYNVDVFLSGHVHAYMRTYPVYNNTVTSKSYINPPSTVHICAGGAGNIEGISTFPQPLPVWYAGGNDQNFGFGTMKIEKNRLTWNYYRSDTGALNDTITIINGH